MQQLGASFRDPSGFVIRDHEQLLRVVQPVYAEHYQQLMESGLYAELVREGWLIPHEEVPLPSAHRDAHRALRPEMVPFVSYPYEWSFSQWKDAALTTLRIQERAIAHGMTLKDASAFNLQFLAGRPVMIDTLSFEKLVPTKPWVAYHQFCRHFLAPLALMSYRDVRLGQWLRIHLDGIPLELASLLLPGRSYLNLWLLVHLHLHARSQKRFSTRTAQEAKSQFGLNSLRGLISSLTSAVQRLRWEPRREVWANYYAESVTGGQYLEHKRTMVRQWLESLRPRSVWDLGANTGLFSRLAAERGMATVAFDGDPECVELTYRECRKHQEKHLLPLVLDLANPSPGLGWEHRERSPWLERGQPDLVLALALVHHLAIGNNVPLEWLARFFHRFAPHLAIEFVPKHDPNAQKLLRVREDVFTSYTESAFVAAFERYFDRVRSERLADSERTLFLFRRRSDAP